MHLCACPCALANSMQTNKHLIQDINSSQQPLKRVYAYSPAAKSSSYCSPSSNSPVSQTQMPKRKRPTRIIAIAVVVIIGTGILLNSYVFKSNESHTSTAVKSASQEKVAPKVIKKIDYVDIESQINSIIQKYPELQISASFNDLKTSTKTNYGVADTFRAASTTKLLSAVLFLKETENGKYSIDQLVGGSPAKTQLQLLIEKSDNTAWDAFDRLLGGQALDNHARQIGMINYSSSRNRTTSADIAILLEKLYKGELLNEQNTQLLLSHMQNASEKQYIMAAVPPGSKAYHKAGYLVDRLHDAAIIDDGKHPFALVIFSMASSGQYSYPRGAQMTHEITEVILSAYRQI